MTKQEMIRRTREAMMQERKLPANIRFQRMIDAGIINKNGEHVSTVKK